MRTPVIFFVSLVLLASCCGKRGNSKSATQWGDSIATIDNTTYYWLQLADDSARISAVKDNKVATECIVRGPKCGCKIDIGM